MIMTASQRVAKMAEITRRIKWLEQAKKHTVTGKIVPRP